MADPIIFWAKSSPYQSLPDHMIETGICAQLLVKAGAARSVFCALQDHWGLSAEESVNLIGFLAAFHDIGKCHPYFQNKCPELPCVHILAEQGYLYSGLPQDKIARFRHELYSAEILKTLLQNNDVPEETAAALCRITSLHHQGKARRMELRIPSACHPQKWRDAQAELTDRLVRIFRPPFHKLDKAKNIDAVLQELLGLIILSDWIASGEPCEETAGISKAIAQRGLETLDAPLPSGSFCGLWSEIPGNSLRGIQQAAEGICSKVAPGFCLIEAPMGEGKSEAAVYIAACQMAAYQKSGLYMAMPTAATGNQMYFRLNRLLAEHGLPKSRLLHATAWIVDEQTPEAALAKDADGNETNDTASQWLAPAKRGLLSQYAVGTVDQVMMSVMNVRYGAVRLLGLSNKVLILDEIHAYDTYMQTIIERLIRWCRVLDVPLVLLSASLPLYKKRAFLSAYGAGYTGELSQSYPVITTVDRDGKTEQTVVERVHMHRQYSVSVQPLLEDDRATALLAAQAVENGGCLCVLVNTVKRAQAVYTELKNAGFDGELFLFHARFPAQKRQSIENAVTDLFGRKNNKHHATKPVTVTYSGCTTATETSTKAVGGTFKTQFAVDSYSEYPYNVTATMNGTALVSGTGFTYSNSTGLFTLSGTLTGNVAITCTKQYHTVTYNYIAGSSSLSTSAIRNGSFSTTFTEKTPKVDVTMGGTDYTGYTYDPSTGAFSISKVTGDVVIHGYYTVTYNPNGGSVSSPSEGSTAVKGGAKAPVPTATKTDSTIQGWYSDSGLSTKWTFGSNTVTGNTTLYAKWDTWTTSWDTDNCSKSTSTYDTKSRDEYRTRTSTYYWYKDTAYSKQASDCGSNCVGSSTYNWTQRSYTTSSSSSLSGWTKRTDTTNPTSSVSYGAWGSWTGYSYTSCSGSTTKECGSTTCTKNTGQYAYCRCTSGGRYAPCNGTAHSACYTGYTSWTRATSGCVAQKSVTGTSSAGGKTIYSGYWYDEKACTTTYTCYRYRTRTATTNYTYYYYKDTAYSNQASKCSSNCVGSTTYNYTQRTTTTTSDSTMPSGYTGQCTSSTQYCTYASPIYGEWESWTAGTQTASDTTDTRQTCVYRLKAATIN